MFTGLVEEVGRVRRVERQGAFQRLEIGARRVLEEARVGDSINIDGACQTLVALGADYFAVESVEETLARTTLGSLRAGSPVNLERALRLGARLGGHLLLGHVDGVGRIRRLEARRRMWLLEVETPAGLGRYIAPKGSVAVDGISLTVAGGMPGGFTVALIPHTFNHTNLSQRKGGDCVNLEVDLIARYLERLLGAGTAGLSLEKLRQMGY